MPKVLEPDTACPSTYATTPPEEASAPGLNRTLRIPLTVGTDGTSTGETIAKLLVFWLTHGVSSAPSAPSPFRSATISATSSPFESAGLRPKEKVPPFQPMKPTYAVPPGICAEATGGPEEPAGQA